MLGPRQTPPPPPPPPRRRYSFFDHCERNVYREILVGNCLSWCIPNGDLQSPTVPSRRRLYSGHSIRTVLMSPKAWRPNPMPARCVEGAPLTIFLAAFISSRWTHSICLVAKFTGRSPVYTPASSQTPPKPSSRPRSVSKPSDRRTPRPEATVRVIKPFSLLTVSVCVGTVSLRTSFSRSNPYRPGGMLRVCSGPPGASPRKRFSLIDVVPPRREGDCFQANVEAPVSVADVPLEGDYLPPLNVRKYVEHTGSIWVRKLSNLIVKPSTSQASKKAAAHDVGNLAEGRVRFQFDDPQKWFGAKYPDIFENYPLTVSSDKAVQAWRSNPMQFWQNQLNFAVWCATTGSGVSLEDHLSAADGFLQSFYRFHVYYQIRRILVEIQGPLPRDRAWDAVNNPYDRGGYERICDEFPALWLEGQWLQLGARSSLHAQHQERTTPLISCRRVWPEQIGVCIE